jgi:folate-binding protein YgfZ
MLSPAPSPFKAKAVPAGLHRLSGHSLLACEGIDAAAFLQAQSMNDVRALAPGQWHWNGWLNPKGRVICLFALWRRGEQEFALLLPDFPAAELQPLLQRFVFRSKLRLSAIDDQVVAGEFAATPGVDSARREFVAAHGEGSDFDLSGEGGARLWRVLQPDSAEAAAAAAGFDAAWLEADLAHGLPRLDASQREAWTPQMLSLDRLRAFSLSKGCYPGQEIVARTHYLGQAKRTLVRLLGAGPRPGMEVLGADGRAVGTVVAAGGQESLAVLAADHPGPLRVEAATVGEAKLLGGLQRPV